MVSQREAQPTSMDSGANRFLAAEWNKQADVKQIVKVFKDFDPILLKLIEKVEPSSVKVWQLMDMEKLPSWTSGKLALLGDAAHPFTPRKSSLAARKLHFSFGGGGGTIE